VKIFIVLILLLLYSPTLPAKPLATVINKEETLPYKCSIDLRISEKLGEAELKKAALNIYKKINGEKYRLVFINWYLPGMKINSGAWASTDFETKLQINIYK